jgi:hypothetical protein
MDNVQKVKNLINLPSSQIFDPMSAYLGGKEIVFKGHDTVQI